MKLPRQYSYNPEWRILLSTFSASPAWMGLVWFLREGRPSPVGISFGFLLTFLGVLVAVRRFVLKRHLVLDSDALMLPTGFLRLRTRRIPYVEIERVWQVRLLWMPVLCIRTKRGKFEVLSGMLPNANSYIEVGNFLNSQAGQASS